MMSNQEAVERAKALIEKRDTNARIREKAADAIERRRADDEWQAAKWQLSEYVSPLLAEVERLRAALASAKRLRTAMAGVQDLAREGLRFNPRCDSFGMIEDLAREALAEDTTP